MQASLLSLCRTQILLGGLAAYLPGWHLTAGVRGERALLADALLVGGSAVLSTLLTLGLFWWSAEIIGLLAALVRLRQRGGGPTIGWFATVGPASWTAGLWLGAAVGRGAGHQAGLLLLALGPLLGTCGAIWIILRPTTGGADDVLFEPALVWTSFSMLAPVGLGLLFVLDGGDGQQTAHRLLLALSLAAVVVQGLVAPRLVALLLRPFEPSDIGSKGLGLASRCVLALLVVTPYMPFACLVAPLWIHLRFRVLDGSPLLRRAGRFRLLPVRWAEESS